MARPERHIFPIWNPQRITRMKFNDIEFKTRYKALRNSSSAFIKRNDVRNIVFENDFNKCVKCGSTANLQVDHINSVYLCACGIIKTSELNIISNLQTLCLVCNSSKKPEGEINGTTSEI